MKSLIQEINEGLTPLEREDLVKLAAERKVCTCVIIKEWLAAAYLRMGIRREVEPLTDEHGHCCKLSEVAVPGAAAVPDLDLAEPDAGPEMEDEEGALEALGVEAGLSL